MALRKPKITHNNIENLKNINDSARHNFSHQAEHDNISFNLPQITLEDLDNAVINEFDKKFTVNNSPLRLINGAADTTSIPLMYPELINKEKEFVMTPVFTGIRTKTKKKIRNNPSYKPVTYTVPQMKPEGLIYEEWVVEPAIWYNLIYSFVFITEFKDTQNEFLEQLSYYFRNKANIIIFQGNRFSIRPDEGYAGLFDTTEESLDSPDKSKYYMLKFDLNFEAYTRSLENMIKREKPNKYLLNISVKNSDNSEILLNQVEIKLKNT